jgi:hypothetical protein
MMTIQAVFADPGCFIPDPNFCHPGSRIRHIIVSGWWDCLRTQKGTNKTMMKRFEQLLRIPACLFWIPDPKFSIPDPNFIHPGSEFFPFRILDPP